MNFEKLILKNKNNICIIFVLVIVLFFLTIPNKVEFLYKNPLGRAYLIALLIIVTTYNRYLGLIAVLIVASIYNSSDTITENFVEGNEENNEEETGFLDSTLNAMGFEKKGEEKTAMQKRRQEKEGKEGNENYMTRTDIVDAESNMMFGKESFSLMSIPNLFKSSKEPRANWSDQNAYGLPFAPIK